MYVSISPHIITSINICLDPNKILQRIRTSDLLWLTVSVQELLPCVVTLVLKPATVVL